MLSTSDVKKLSLFYFLQFSQQSIFVGVKNVKVLFDFMHGADRYEPICLWIKRKGFYIFPAFL